MFRFGAKARLIKKLRKNSDDLHTRLYEVFKDDILSQHRIDIALNDIEELIQYIESCKDTEIEKKIILALKNY